MTSEERKIEAKEPIDADHEVYALKMIDEIYDRIISRCHHRIRSRKTGTLH